MSYRRIALITFAGFMGYLLFTVIKMDTPTSAGAVWPLVVGLLIILMLPEKRLGGQMIVDLVKALKRGSDGS